MAKNASLSLRFRQQLLSADIRSLFNGGELRLFAGTKPVNAQATEGISPLATLVLPTPAFSSDVSAGELVKTGTWTGPTLVAGTPLWFRLYAADQTGPAILTGVDSGSQSARIDGTVGITVGAFDLVLETASIELGQGVFVATFVLPVRANVVG